MRESVEWIKGLKVGDEVAIDISSYWNKNLYKKETVEKITPTGRIKTSDGSQFYPNGREIGKGYVCKLKQITPEIEECMKRRELLYKLEFDKMKGFLSSEQLELLLKWQDEILKGG